ncbi:hypothetical protein HUT18_12370 [Streptomyces sp. NA04227]|uniref:hypothetical protein n=1 Tax=Streptomyces sp. NA04227 TaxID=2742136 RepID=UPI001590AD97|nr:hypothetical protein [Streptomyces sp. NA04227]QKW07078.1 hypothetical protein HUT18_12370 [Streptomyces sp. NA04227]
MSEIADTGPRGTTARNTPGTVRTAHEAYSFACMRCGHGWEQAYEIEHHVDPAGEPYVTYLANGVRVPSPLTRPTCLNCGGHVVRIMRPGRVSSVQSYLAPQPPERGAESASGAVPHDYGPPAVTGPVGSVGSVSGAGEGVARSVPADPVKPGAHVDESDPAEGHHWHLSDLLHPFRGRRQR